MHRLIILTMAAIAAAACATVDDAGTPAEQAQRARYSGRSGESPVGVIPDIQIRDAARNRELRVSIEYPTRPGPHPLVLFSTGANVSRGAYVGFSSYWSSHGYVVGRITHPDASPAGERGSLQEDGSTQTAADWRNRARDVSLVIDSIPSLIERYPELEGKIDSSSIGVGGHSYGAFTALLVGGLRTFPDGQTVPDERVKAVLAMSPPGPGPSRGLTPESFAALRLPVLFITGTRDTGAADDETPEWRAQAFRLAAPGDKWLAVIEGARHASFTGRVDDLLEEQAREREVHVPVPDGRYPSREPAPRLPGVTQNTMLRERDVLHAARFISLAFWDAYLRGDTAGREMLERLQGSTLENR